MARVDLPGVVPNGANITVRMLLQHTSGLFNYTADSEFVIRAIGESTTPIPVKDILETVFSHPANFAPGTDWEYSNTGYVVLGQMLQTVTGRPLGELLQRRIAKPLHLWDTHLADPFAEKHRSWVRARLHRRPQHRPRGLHRHRGLVAELGKFRGRSRVHSP
jgi:D-alanyl-D-alanine carboxypeptidase